MRRSRIVSLVQVWQNLFRENVRFFSFFVFLFRNLYNFFYFVYYKDNILIVVVLLISIYKARLCVCVCACARVSPLNSSPIGLEFQGPKGPEILVSNIWYKP